MKSRSPLKKGCSPNRWERTATAIAIQAGVDHIKVLAGDRRSAFVAVRWRAWRSLADAGFSYFSIGQASRFDHTTVIHACDADMRARSRARHLVHGARSAA